MVTSVLINCVVNTPPAPERRSFRCSSPRPPSGLRKTASGAGLASASVSPVRSLRVSELCKGQSCTFPHRYSASPRRKMGQMNGCCVRKWTRPSNDAAMHTMLPAGYKNALSRSCGFGGRRQGDRRSLMFIPPASRKDLDGKLDSSGYSSSSSTQILKPTIPGCGSHEYFISIKKEN